MCICSTSGNGGGMVGFLWWVCDKGSYGGWMVAKTFLALTMIVVVIGWYWRMVMVAK